MPSGKEIFDMLLDTIDSIFPGLIGLLSGTNNIIDSIAFANSLILAQYMKEN